jgi:hypothetical protein
VPRSDALIDLLGALAYGQLSAFDQLAHDARLAPTLDGRAEMSAMAATELGDYRRLAARLDELGCSPADAMAPFVSALDTYHSLTQPSTWLESVVKAYVGEGLAADFYREVAAFVDEPTRELIYEVIVDADRARFASREVRSAIGAATDGTAVVDRAALWARRLLGEASSRTQHVLAERDALMLLLVDGAGGLSGIAELTARVTERHSERMRALGLAE